MILVDHGVNTTQTADFITDDGDATAATGDHHVAAEHERPDRVHLLDVPGLWRSDHTPPAAPGGVFGHRPALLHIFVHFLFGHEPADGLRRRVEGRIIRIDTNLSDDRRNSAVNAQPPQRIVERLLQHVADTTLGIGDDEVERHFMDAFSGGKLGPAQDEAHLRAVPVRDDNVPAVGNHISDVAAGFADGVPLVFHFGLLRVFD